jgi:hypothetical protein
MPQYLPHLTLSQGQVGWVLSLGQPAGKLLVDQMRYLRTLGVPFSAKELGGGRGNWLRSDYYQLTETGVAIAAIRRGMSPAEAAKVLVDNRAHLRALYKQAFLEQPEGALHAAWVKSRGREMAMLANHIDLRLHKRYSSTPGKIQTVVVPSNIPGVQVGDALEQFDDETVALVPLSRLVLEWTAWALEAPELRPGPQR